MEHQNNILNSSIFDPMVFGQGQAHGQGQSWLDLRQEKRSRHGHRLPDGHLRPRGHGQKRDQIHRRGEGLGQNVPHAVPQIVPQNVPRIVPPFIPHPILTQETNRMTENSSPFSVPPFPGVPVTPITPKKPSSIDGIADRLQIAANLKAYETRTLRIEAEDYYRIRSPILQSFREVRNSLMNNLA